MESFVGVDPTIRIKDDRISNVLIIERGYDAIVVWKFGDNGLVVGSVAL